MRKAESEQRIGPTGQRVSSIAELWESGNAARLDRGLQRVVVTSLRRGWEGLRMPARGFFTKAGASFPASKKINLRAEKVPGAAC